MLKSEFVLRPGAVRQLAFLLPLTAACLALSALPYSAQTWLPASSSGVLIACLIVITLFWQICKKLRFYSPGENKPRVCKRRKDDMILVDTDGDYWHEREQGAVTRLRINPRRCRVFPFALYLAFISESGGQRHRWVLASECEPLYYRRLIRVISAS